MAALPRGQKLTATRLDGTPLEIDLNTLPPGPGDEFTDFGATLTVTLVSLPGDYNDDGVVDAADYTVGRDAEGSPAGTLANNTDGGVIGAAQYDTRVAHYGDTLPAALSVPEPGCAALLLLGYVGLACGVFRTRRGCLAAAL